MANILVVDDERQIRESLLALLQSTGIGRVDAAATADEATEIAARHPPDLLIVDWMLGDSVDGVALAERLQQAFPHLKTILVTGYLSTKLQEKVQGMSHMQVFLKPCPHEEFMQAVENSLPRPA